jgi:two-component SAPR family response regulator
VDVLKFTAVYTCSVLSSEDKKLLNIVLVKSQRRASECWKSLLVDQYMADPFTFTEMEKKLTLERFQSEVKAVLKSTFSNKVLIFGTETLTYRQGTEILQILNAVQMTHTIFVL